MDSQRPAAISVIDPINPAIDRVKLMLFQPFDLGRWFIIGFCAWLASLGKGGGGGGGHGGGGYRGCRASNIHEDINHARVYFQENISWIVPLVIFVVLGGILLWLVFTWLSSRGKFMFLHCVAENKAEVKLPWLKFREHANSLFVFRIVLFLVGFAAIGLPILLVIGFAVMMAASGAPAVTAIFGGVMIAFIVLAIAIALALVSKFTTDFVVPIMFMRTTSCTAAWREFLSVLSENKARFALYILFQIVIAIAIGAVIFVGFCVGFCCCCASILLFIPYINTVVLLPVHVFGRSYSLYYFRQFGVQFDVFGLENPQPELVENPY
jgi:hypothetical protein